MNPLAVEALGAIVRWVLTIGAGYFVQHGIWTADAASTYVAAGALGLVTLGWSLYRKYSSRMKLLTAIANSGSTEHEVEAQVASSVPNPSVTTAKTDTPTF